MGWDDRHGRYRVDPDRRLGSGFGRAVRRVFGDGRNPFEWAVPLFTIWRIVVRVHVVFVVYAIAELLHASLAREGVGLANAAVALGGLFVLVLAHEFGHCLVCRRVGGDADEILMWPLGGLARCMPPERWRAHLATAAGGPLVNLALIPVLAGVLIAATGGIPAVWFNPFSPGQGLAHATLPDGTAPFWLTSLWWLHYVNLVLLGFNVLVPMYPMDGGRMLQALLWKRVGYTQSMHAAAVVGLVVAVGMFVFAMVFNQTMLAAIAIFGGVTCWLERQRLVGEPHADAGIDLSAAFEHPDAWKRDPGPPARAPAQPSREPDPQEVDRILAKISSQGMDSLNRIERKTLRQASRSARDGR